MTLRKALSFIHAHRDALVVTVSFTAAVIVYGIVGGCAAEPKSTADIVADICRWDGGQPLYVMTPWRTEVECAK